MKKPKGYWTKERVFEEAKKYKTRKDFQKGCVSAYQSALKHGWLDDYTWMVNGKILGGLKRTKWNKKTVFAEAKKYQSRTEFARNSSGAYEAARRNGWLKDYTWFVDGRAKLFLDKIDSVYKYVFEDGAIYIGRTLMNRQNERVNEHQADTDTVGKYAKENGLEVPQMEIIEEKITPIEGLQREDYWVNYYKEKGYNVINKGKTGIGSGSLGAIDFGKWNKKTVFEEAKKYKTRYEFYKGSCGAYEAARKNKWLKEMDWFEGKKHWDKESVFKEALKYKTKNEFKKGCNGAYRYAIKNGLIKEMDWFEEVLKPKGYWNKETVFAEGKKYQSRNEFKKGSVGAYGVALKHKWMDILFPKKVA